MSDTWLYIGIFFLVAPLVPAIAILIPKVIAPRKPNTIKLETYECGIETVGDSQVQFRVQYYIFALVFLIFDIEAVFLFPWAVAFKKLGAYGFFAILPFMFLLAASLVYEWKRGALEWD